MTGVMAAVTDTAVGVVAAAVASMAAAGATAVVAALGVCVPFVMAVVWVTRVGKGEAVFVFVLAVLIGCMVNTVELAGGDGEVAMRAVAAMLAAGDMLRAGVRCSAPVGVS